MTQLEFNQVDVFTTGAYTGNPLAVVHDADDLTDQQMAQIANWQNLSETAFVLKPSSPEADYRVRIFSPVVEMPFAGHPTLGTVRAVLNRGIKPKNSGYLIQECAKGLIKVKIDGEMLYFSAPEAEIDVYGGDALSRAVGAPNLSLTAAVVDIGPRFVVLPLDSAEMVRAFEIDSRALGEICQEANVIGLMTYGPNPPGSNEPKYEARTHCHENGAAVEDPVCGSGNAAVARYIEAFGDRSDYDVRQGTCLGRKGLLCIRFTENELWVGGKANVTTTGRITV